MSPPSAAVAHGGWHMADQEQELAAQLRALKAAHEHERAQAAARMRFVAHISPAMLCSTMCLNGGLRLQHGCQQAGAAVCQEVDLLSQACCS